MRYQKVLFMAILILFMTMLFGCKKDNTPKTDDDNPTIDPVVDPEPTKHVEIISSVLEITLKSDEVKNYDYKALFEVYEDYEQIEVKDEYLNLSSLKEVKGTYYISCSYSGVWKRVKVKVEEYTYNLTLKTDSITLKESEVDNYDFLSLFEATKDFNIDTITDITSNVKNISGEYIYQVTYQGMTKTLNVKVIPTYDIEVFKAYEEISVEDSKFDSFDYKTLFNVFIDGKYIQVTNEMLEIPSIGLGEEKEVKIMVSKGTNFKTNSVLVKRVNDYTPIINTKTVVTYPNSKEFDFKDLFEVSINGTKVNLTDDMISGSVDYSLEGDYPITLNYNDNEYVSTIKVIHGVIIEYATSDIVNISLNTNIDTYDFAKDFKVIINGITYKSLDLSYIDYSNVDFKELGTYKAKISIPYNTNSLSLSGVNFTYYEKEITYNVIPNVYELNVKNSLIEADSNTNLFDNISLKIRGRNYVIEDNINADYIVSAYAKVNSEIDYNTPGIKDVEILVYVDGVNSNPIKINYQIMVNAGINITTKDAHIFSNNYVLPNSLFEINDRGESITVTDDMIYGSVNYNEAGSYSVYLNYKGIIKEAMIYVNDSSIIGTYQTKMKKLTGKSYSTLTIDEDFNISFENADVTVLDNLGNNTFVISIGSYEYTMQYVDGIIFLDPDNALKLSFHDMRRPLVFFNKDLYNFENCLVVNSLQAGYVLDDTYTGYSFDIFTVKNSQTEEIKSYGLKTHLTYRMSSDTLYDVSFGEVKDLVNEETYGSFKYQNEFYEFNNNNGTLTIKKNDETTKPYKNKTFTGLIDGISYKLVSDQYEAFSLIGEKLVFSASYSDISLMDNGGVNYDTNTIFLYDTDKIYSYKFILDTSNNTFTYLERDKYFGKYVFDNYFIFLDGYGTGIVSFDANSYYEYQIKYVVSNNKLTIYFININQTFEEGSYVSFFVSPLYNKLTYYEGDSKSFDGVDFTNSVITYGAIINLSKYQFETSSDSIGRTSLLEAISITTKDGTLTGADLNANIPDTKVKYVDYSKISFGNSGFYELKINVLIDEEIVTSYYAIEVMKETYKDNSLVGYYTKGFNSEASISISKYGKCNLVISGFEYEGFINILSDGSFSATLYSGNKEVVLNGYELTNGVIFAQTSGAVSLSDCFTTYDIKKSGNSKYILYEVNGAYLIFRKGDAKGVICTLASLNEIEAGSVGSMCELKSEKLQLTILINSWNNLETGLEIVGD